MVLRSEDCWVRSLCCILMGCFHLVSPCLCKIEPIISHPVCPLAPLDQYSFKCSLCPMCLLTCIPILRSFACFLWRIWINNTFKSNTTSPLENLTDGLNNSYINMYLSYDSPNRLGVWQLDRDFHFRRQLISSENVALFKVTRRVFT